VTIRRRVSGGLVLLLLGAVAGLVFLLSPSMSQLCLFPPSGAKPPPAAVAGQPSGSPGPAVLAFAGDAMLGRRVGQRFAARPGYRPWRDLGPLLEGVDLFALNLECSITASRDRWPHKQYAFRLDPAQAHRALSTLPVPVGAASYASLGNNHALDFGGAGLAESIAQLDALGWQHSGAGADAVEAQRPAIITTATGVRIGVLSAADHCSCRSVGSWVAGDAQPGLWHVDMSWGRWDHLLEAVASLDDQVDLVVLSMHWGINYSEAGPPAWMRRLARALVEAGADIVVGHSAHQVLPVELIDGKHVFYGLGDLMHDYASRPEHDNQLGMVARISVAPDGSQVADLRPFRIDHMQVVPLESGDPDHATVLRRAGWPPD
jgi:poly-gamma-glutamate capsule biosynthesis protein CapA/YwtB (metallophosphatase superfamily)